MLILVILAVIELVSGIDTYANTLSLTSGKYRRSLDFTVPHINNGVVMYAIRDLDSVSKFEWWMHHDLSPINNTHDCLTFTFGQDWPTGKIF
jgi:hypothetical protein